MLKLCSIAAIEGVKEEIKDTLNKLNNFFIFARYPDNFDTVNKLLSKEKAKEIYNKTERIFKWPEKNYLNLNKKLSYYIKALTKAIEVDKIILFGSYATGKPHEYSDIDIALVSPELYPRVPTVFHNIEVARKASLYDGDIQLFAFPKEKFDKEEGVQGSFIREIKKTGKVIYQRPSYLVS